MRDEAIIEIRRAVVDEGLRAVMEMLPSVADQVAEEIAGGSQTTKEIAAALGISKNYASMLAKALTDRGCATRKEGKNPNGGGNIYLYSIAKGESV